MKKERQSNFELLRIIAMLMVVTLHFMGHGGILDNVKVFSTNFYIANLLQSFSIYAVNIYVLISAYFMCDSKITMEKVIKVWTQVVFYTVGIYLALLLVGIIDFNIIELVKSFFPITLNQYSFVTAYIILMSLSPFLNKLINSMNKDEFKRLIIIVSMFVIILGVGFPINKVVGSYVSNFIILYFISAYIKRYLQNKLNNKYSLLLYVCSSLLIFIGRILLFMMDKGNSASALLSYRFILVVLGSIGLFTLFMNIKIKSKLINNVSILTFGVFLIHENYFIRKILYSEIFKIDTLYNSKYLILYTVISIFIVYIICSLIEYIRQVLFNIFKIDKISFKIIDGIIKFIKKLYKRIKEIILDRLMIS